MFWKMLKSDLRQKRGLSIVLFVFIAAASVLVFVGGTQIYQYFTGAERNRTACKSSDMLVYNTGTGNLREFLRQAAEKVMDENPHIVGRYHREMLKVPVDRVDFAYVDEQKVNELLYAEHYLTTIPKERDLLYTMDDQPFAPDNGTVWICEDMRSVTGAQVGDTLKITGDLGNVYCLTIAGFYKKPYGGFQKWYVISEGDYNYLSQEISTVADMYGLQLDNMSIPVYIELSDKLRQEAYVSTELLDPESSNDHILSYIISIFIAVVSLFMILIVVMTIRFTMIAALKEEEREIGVLRAIGADSLQFRWLFAAKYICFAVIGGMIGMAVGMPLSRTVFSMFAPGSIQPSDGEVLLIGVAAVLLITVLIIGFSLIVMRRINKISVISAIRGENHAERFSGQKGLLLHKRKKMAPSFYLACSDLLKRFKRYVFLLVSYTLGVLIVLFVVNIKHSIITPDYLKYLMMYQTDFYLEFTTEQFLDYYDKIQLTGEDWWDLINQEIKDAGIDAHIDAEHYQNQCTLLLNGQDISATVLWGPGDISRLSYHEGTVPVHKDEIALSWSSANALGIQSGDEITLKIPCQTDGTQEVKYKEDTFRVTAFINAIDNGMPIAVTGPEYEGVKTVKCNMAMIIDSGDKEQVLEQLKAHFGEDVAISGMEYTRKGLADYASLFDLLEYVGSAAVLFILMLITYLYTSVFIAEETAEIALLKSIGFRDITIKGAHLFRILLLAVTAVLLGELLLATAGQWIIGMLMENLGITGFSFLPEFWMSWLAVPVLTIGCVLLTQWLNLRKIRRIDICHIKDE